MTQKDSGTERVMQHLGYPESEIREQVEWERKHMPWIKVMAGLIYLLIFYLAANHSPQNSGNAADKHLHPQKKMLISEFERVSAGDFLEISGYITKVMEVSGNQALVHLPRIGGEMKVSTHHILEGEVTDIMKPNESYRDLQKLISQR